MERIANKEIKECQQFIQNNIEWIIKNMEICMNKKLLNKKWLIKKYKKEKLSCYKIGRLIGCSGTWVRRILLKYQIPINDRIYNKNKFLNNEAWLREKYLEKKLSSFRIAKITKCHPNSVIGALKRYNIKRRTGSYALLCNRKNDWLVLNKKSLDVINGSLLGDATINMRKNNGIITGTPFFSKGNINLDHVEYVAKLIFQKDWAKRIFHRPARPPMITKNGKRYSRSPIFEIRSFSHKELLPIFNKWYKTARNKDNQKIIPDDLKINGTVLLNWFMDDGSAIIHHHKRKNKKYNNENLYISLATNGFYKKDVAKLIQKINKGLGLKGTLTRSKYGFGYSIVFPENQVDKFYRIIGNCPVKSMQYKWIDINLLRKPKHNDKRWENTFIKLRTFIAKNKRFPSKKASNSKNEIRLSKWVTNQKMVQRGVIKSALFNQYRVGRLETLPRWEWDKTKERGIYVEHR